MKMSNLVVIVLLSSVVHAQDRPIGFASLEGEGSKRVIGGTTGGAGGKVVTVTTDADLQKYITSPQPYIILVSGKINVQPKGKEYQVASDKTILGLRADATISGGGFFLGAGVHNVIIRNLTIRDTKDAVNDPTGKELDYDGIQMDGAHHVWIDHCFFTNINDGMIDSRKDTDYLTVSWNKFLDHNKTFGIGWTTNMIAKLTIHHNWISKSIQRNPSCDNATCHLFNNFLEDLGSYGNYARGKADMVIENSVFRNAKDPWYHDATAKLTAKGNITEGTITGLKMSNGTAFDPKKHYSYTLDATDKVKSIVMAGAGPQAHLGVAPTSVGSPRDPLVADHEVGTGVAVDLRGRAFPIDRAAGVTPPIGVYWVREADGRVTKRTVLR